LVLRIEDIDGPRCRPEFVEGAVEDLAWLGLDWDEGPVYQSGRFAYYREVLRRLAAGGWIYPCRCSRKDLREALAAPHESPAFPPDEPLYPGTCRPSAGGTTGVSEAGDAHWRFRVPDGERMAFRDGRLGEVEAVAGRDFGDFVVWRRDGIPAYQLAVVADDGAMGITEVVRGEDLVLSTFRQLLIYRALGWEAPAFYHAPLLRDAAGERLAKRHDALSLRALRAAGRDPAELWPA
jgi:glutamyl-tRNA synthetase